MVKALLGKRRADLHKGNCGKVLAIAGSLGMTGAAFLCAEAALRSGAGLVTLAAPKSQQQILAVKLTEAMTQPLPDADGHLAADAVKKMLALSENADVVLIGSGLGRAEETMQAVRQFLLATDKKVVIDADAIFAIKDNAAILRKMKKMPVLTPHIGEMSFLTKERREFIAANMQDAATKTARELNAIIALKSARTVVAYPDGAVYINNKGNAGMATGGSGDVLAGTVAGFLAQYPSEEKIAAAAVYVHAVAGDFAAEGGMEGLIAGDILRALPKARAHIEADDL
jgi:NAD(P)H-hydrate epimerase